MTRKVTPDMFREMEELRATGLTQASVAKRLGISLRTVRNWLTGKRTFKEGVLYAATGHPVRKVTPEMLEEMKELRSRGISCDNIGMIMGISRSTASRWLNGESQFKIEPSRTPSVTSSGH